MPVGQGPTGTAADDRLVPDRVRDYGQFLTPSPVAHILWLAGRIKLSSQRGYSPGRGGIAT